MHLESQGFLACEYHAAKNMLVFCDARGTVYLCQDGAGAANNRLKVDEYQAEAAQDPGRARRSTTQSQGAAQEPAITEEVKLKRGSTQRITGGSSTAAAGQKKMLKFCRNERFVKFKFVSILFSLKSLLLMACFYFAIRNKF